MSNTQRRPSHTAGTSSDVATAGPAGAFQHREFGEHRPSIRRTGTRVGWTQRRGDETDRIAEAHSTTRRATSGVGGEEAIGLVVGELERRAVGRRCLAVVAQASRQVGLDGPAGSGACQPPSPSGAPISATPAAGPRTPRRRPRLCATTGEAPTASSRRKASGAAPTRAVDMLRDGAAPALRPQVDSSD